MNAFLVKCKCQHCNQHLEFEAARAGENIPCPKCGMETLLFIPPSAAQLAQQKLNEPTYDAKNVGIIFSVIVLLSVLGFVGTLVESDPEMSPFLVLLFGICGGVFYFLPALIATKKRQFGALFALNFLLGWTLIGWAGALVWALIKEKNEI